MTSQPPSHILIILILLLLPLVPLVEAITGSVGTVTAQGHVTTISFNATGPYETRGLMDYISAQFKYPSITEILLRGRFSQLQADNTAPAAPALETPQNNSYLNTTTITFGWTNTTDADNDTLDYILEIYNDTNLTNIHTTNSSIAETATPTQTNITLLDNQTYYWQIIANDSGKNSTPSENRSITVDQILPVNFNLTSPTNGTSSTDNSPNLIWDPGTDSNLDNYTIEISTLKNFSLVDRIQNSTTNSFSDWNSTLDANTYYWRVSAVDKANNQRRSDLPFTFIVTAVSDSSLSEGTLISGSGSSSTKPFSFHIIAPPSITVLQGETITVPITIQNLGKGVHLNRITLTAETNSNSLIATLDKTFINTIGPSTNFPVNLIIQASGVLEDVFSITLSANVDNPKLRDSITIITNVIGETGQNQKSVLQQIDFAKKFYSGNSECQDLIELINEAEREAQNNNLDRAIELTSEAINKCKDLIAVKDSGKKSFTDITINAIKENRTAAIISSEVLGFIILSLFVFKKFIRRKPKEIKLDF
jgi:hypothetical protein